MRYREEGCLHMDFYRTLNATIAYLSAKYGESFLKKTFRHTALLVYGSIHDSLKRGSCRELAEHWGYFLNREGGEYSLDWGDSRVVLRVRRCPAVDYLRRNNIKISKNFCLQTVEMNRALSGGTPFMIKTALTGEGSCVQTVERRKA